MFSKSSSHRRNAVRIRRVESQYLGPQEPDSDRKGDFEWERERSGAVYAPMFRSRPQVPRFYARRHQDLQLSDIQVDSILTTPMYQPE